MLSHNPNMSYRIEGEQLDIDDILAQTQNTRLMLAPRPETVVIMAGGLGTRLLPYTQGIPKSMVPIAGRPMLEHILCQMIRQGFARFHLSVLHLADVIRDHFGNGERWGVEISYLDEPEPLGTAGGLSLLNFDSEHPVIVANTDLITDLDYRRVVEFHKSSGVSLTMCTREAVFQMPYGVITALGDRVIKVDEKPTQAVTISAGMYALSPSVLSRLKSGEPIDMPDFIQRLIDSGEPVGAMSIDDRWVDVGRKATYQALVEYLEHRTDPAT